MFGYCVGGELTSPACRLIPKGMTVKHRKKRKKKYSTNWLKSIRRKRNLKQLYKKRRRRGAKTFKS